ncbi:cilia- and flagella-associated protein 46 isoform X1 [Zootoca vivipara]|uniref:cilia- and flagella-associated protein 46 isoform X1 n=1 Tax=Zootoca vivipara TaxID=8524 RepID=UPI00293BB984|nr:cilia- and flagella-associated protein 46 isoform X1 [Zootoca vivipara]XP_060130819.1 cilia- and flagella-associated protein 46 isoform X1 [Zootoca vivipara]XP_060130820.1 cilia- and flagella-associated protein 46 isoform X1 [Zootoca vivipara]XP_060130821.1 cilia- and flagella-associated protein 46 isoform X1 [Zootoca vivipara]
MEIAIRQHLSDAERHQDVEALKSAYKLIKSANDGKSALDALESFSFDLYVMCAEQAYKMGFPDMSNDCLRMYFKGKPPINQFLGRAYLCKSQLYTPVSTDNLEQFDRFTVHLLKVVDFALGNARYYFLIHNASVMYWRIVRPFLKPGFRHYLIPSLYQIVPALKHPTEQDKDWTAELMIELLECYLDASRMHEAIEFSSTAAAFIKEHVPGRYKQIFSIMVRYKLMDALDIEDEVESSANLNIIYKIQTIKLQLDKNEIPQDVDTELKTIYGILKGSRRKLIRIDRISLLLELARLCLKLNCIPIASLCLSDLFKYKITDPAREIELDCLECDCKVQKLGPKIATYAKSVVEAQLKTIQKLDLILNRAIRLKDPNVIQAVCATLWNTCLPLLQHNLQQHVRRPLLAIAEILEKIDSMLILLRCQVHMEIAHIEENGDRIEAAMEHLQKAIYLDNKGLYHEYLKMAFKRLSVNTMLYQPLERLEDQASLMIEQAKKGTQKASVRKKRSLLVNAGHALAPDAFQIILDSENEVKVASSKSKGPIGYLCAKAEHHSRNVEKADGHLKRIGRENEKERIRLWSEIAKTARKQCVWDVCRAACRFCLLYDDNQAKVSKRKKLFKKRASIIMADEEQEASVQKELPVASPTKCFSLERDLLRTIAEVRFINAEATIQLLRMEGVQLNDHAVVPVDTSLHSAGHAMHKAQTEHESEWKTYSSWIDRLSQYAMENFLRAAKIGEQLNEAWIVHNTVVYVLNHNKHLIAAKRQRELVESLHTLFSAVRNIGHFGNTTILVTLCNALARGLILPWIPKPISKPDEKKVPEEGPPKRRRTAPKVLTLSSAPVLPVDSAGIPDIKAAIEVCEFAMHLPNGSVPDEPVPAAMRQQVVATWVKAKQLVQHQIGKWLGVDDEGNEEGFNPMAKVFIGLEMYSCNGLGLMEFSLPNLSNLVKMALECSWSDSLVELQTMTRLAHFAHTIHDHEMVLTCSQKALELDDKAAYNTDAKKKAMSDYAERQSMLSIAACTQGKSMMENLAGKKHMRLAASKLFVESARYAGEAGDIALAMIAARHFWNGCLPFIGSSADRQQLKKPTEIIIKSINKASEAKHKQEMEHMLHLHQWATSDFQSSSFSDGHSGADEDLTLRTFLYILLFQVYADKFDWEAGLKVLEEANQMLPRTKHRLPIFKQMVMVKARLGRNYIMEIQKFRDESEDYMSDLWHCLASVSSDLVGQLSCYQNAIEVLQKKENALKKVDNLIAFAEWLYCNQFPLSEAIKHLDWAVYILLYLKPHRKSPEEEDFNDQIAIEDIRSIKQLEALFRAHTVMAVISGHSSPFHEQHCLMAYAFVMRIWQVSLAAAGTFLKTMGKLSPTQQTSPKSKGKKDAKQNKDAKPPSANQTSPTSPPKKDKSSKDAKQAQSAKDKAKKKGPSEALPANVEEWASYECPDEIRDAFKQDLSGYALNRETILAPTRTIYYLDLLVKELQTILCTHLTVPVLHLAEIISRDIVESKSLSDLYHLRLSRMCLDLKLCQASFNHEKAVGEVYINEMEQGRFRQDIAFKKENAIQNMLKDTRLASLKPSDSSKKLLIAKDKILELNPVTEKGLSGLSFPYLWIDKAEVLMKLGLYQPARLLLAEAHHATQETNDLCTVSRCLYLLAVLANLEQNHGQAKELLEKAQLIGGNEKFWLNSTLCLTDAILGEDEERKEKMVQSGHFLQRTVNALRPLLLGRPNSEAELGIIITILEARKAYIHVEFGQDFINASSHANDLARLLLEPYDKLIHIEKDFLSHRYKDRSTEVLLVRANIHRILGKHAVYKVDKQSHYLDAYKLAQAAVSQMEELFRYINNVIPVNETKNINTPLMRKLASMKVTFIEIILDIFVLINIEKKRKEAKADQIEQIIEDFVRFTPDVASVEQAWMKLSLTIGHNAQAQLTSLQSLYAGCPDIRAKYLYLTGKCLRLMADHTNPIFTDVHWSEKAAEEPKPVLEKSPSPELEAKCDESETPTPCLLLTRRQLDEYRRKASELRRKQTWTQRYLFQSTEVLMQSINVAMNNNMIDILAAASLEMVECFGRFDSVSASQFLALYQSCSASLMMKNIMLAATLNTSKSQLAAMLHLQHHLQQKGDVTCSLLKNVEHRLAAISKAWGNLSISPQHFNIMNELPPNFHVMILQHSEDRSFLYGALLEKMKLTSPKEQKDHKEKEKQKEKSGQQKEKSGQQKEKSGQQKGKTNQPTLQAKIVRSQVNSNTLMNLLEKVKVLKAERMRRLRRQTSPERSHEDKTEFQKLQESVIKVETGRKNTETEKEDEEHFISEFQGIMREVEEYLKPVLSQFDFSELRPSPAVSPADSGKGKGDAGKTKAGDSGKGKKGSPGKTKADGSGKGKGNEAGKAKNKKEKASTAPAGIEDIGECIILLVDKCLLEFPLEGLNIFQENTISSVSRDFSLQMFYNRLRKDESENEFRKGGRRESKLKGEQKRGMKVPNLNRVLPPNCLPIDIHNVKYVVDPYNDVTDRESDNPAQKFKTLLEKFEPFTLRWDGIMGNTQFASQADWEHLLNNCSAFIFSGLARFLLYTLLERLVAMNLPECQLVILSDLVHSKPSTARVINLDGFKSSARLSLEKPTETTISLSLVGVRSVIANQWYTSLEENATKMESLCENFIRVGKTTGQAVRFLQRSKSAVDEPPKTELDAAGDKKEDQRESPGGLVHPAPQPSACNTVLYGLPNMMFV